MLSHLERCPQEQLGHMHSNSGGYLADHGRKQCLRIVQVARNGSPIQKQNHQHGRIRNKLLGRHVEGQHLYLLWRERQQKKQQNGLNDMHVLLGSSELVELELEVEVDLVDVLQQWRACPEYQGDDRRAR